MVCRRLAKSAGLGCLVCLTAFLLTVPSYKAADTLPRELADDAYWKMVSDFSEQSGSFRFEYMSNELQFQYVIPRLKRSEEHTSELQSRLHLVCRLLLEKKKIKT